jgi:hypothetical protein
MQTWADEQLAILRGRNPQWDIWYVAKFPIGYTWCARRKGEQVSSIQVDSPDAMTAAILVAGTPRCAQ